MKRIFAKSIVVPATLLLLSGMTIAFALVQTVQIPLGALPPESMRIGTAPFSHFAHALGGAVFGLLGPIQFGRVLAQKYGKIHRILGRVFVLSGAVLSLSSLSLLWQFPDGAPALVSWGRLVFGIGLGGALIIAMLAVRKRDFTAHRDWMIRAYAIGIGATLVSIVFLPIFIITGVPPMGLTSDIVFIGSWAGCVVFAEWLVRRLHRKAQAAKA